MSCQELKQKGNKYFSQNDYEKAVTLYTEALEQCPTENTIYSNRSIALIKLGRFEEALQDAAKCIELDPKFARGYLRKCTVLNELGRFEEALEPAQEGYKLRGSDTISQNCISQWLVAIQAIFKEKVESTQNEIEFVFPDQCLVISDDYLTLVLNLLIARINYATTGVPVNLMTAHLFKIFQEFDRVLQLFGHSPSPYEEEWIHALWHASKIDPSSSMVPTSAVVTLLSKSEQLATWLHDEVDHILYPIVCPIISLAMMSVIGRVISLNCVSTEHHVVEVACRACIPFFEKPLSAPMYAEQHIAVYKEMFEASAAFSRIFSKQEVERFDKSIRNLESLLKQTPQCTRDTFEKAMVSIGLIRLRLNQNPGFDHISYASSHGKAVSRGSLEDVLSFVEAKEEALKAMLKYPLKDSLPEFVIEDAQSLLSCTSALLRIGESSKAAEIFNLGELVLVRVLQRQILNKSFSLDTGPEVLRVIQNAILISAKSFLGANDKLVADAIIKWKCIFSEFRAILMQLGIGSKYLATFRDIQEMYVQRKLSSSEKENQLVQLAEKHQREVHEVMCVKGMLLLNILLKQNHEEVQKVLKPGQIILEYCPAENEYSYSKSLSTDAEEEDGLLLVLQAEKAPIIKSMDFRSVAACADRWIKTAPKCSKEEAAKLSQEVCNLLIPPEVQIVMNSACVQQVLLCPDPTFTLIPIELLPLPDGQLLGEKCSLVYLSAARELLRKSAFATTQSIFSVIQEHGKNAKEDGGTDATQDHAKDLTGDLIQIQSSTSMGVRSPVLMAKKKCVIFADPNYDLERPTEESDVSIMDNLVTTISTLFLKPSEQTGIASRLPKTRDEAHEIEYTLSAGENSFEVQCFLGDEATLSSVLQVESPFVVHFSTHGFAKPSVIGVSGTFWDDTKCGLILAGSNTYRQGKLAKILPVAGTGELTALAAMGMKLHGTCLVYLSTCISAQGSVASGESVNSIAQAFRAAGAQTVVATLWTVLDNEARIFAVHFYYEACKTGVRPSQALSSAKKKMQELGYHWIFWSSFICIGEDVPLFA